MSYQKKIDDMVGAHVAEYQLKFTVAKELEGCPYKPAMPYGYPLTVYKPMHTCLIPQPKPFHAHTGGGADQWCTQGVDDGPGFRLSARGVVPAHAGFGAPAIETGALRLSCLIPGGGNKWCSPRSRYSMPFPSGWIRSPNEACRSSISASRSQAESPRSRATAEHRKLRRVRPET